MDVQKIRRNTRHSLPPRGLSFKGSQSTANGNSSAGLVPAFTERLSKQNHLDLAMMSFLQVTIQIEIR